MTGPWGPLIGCVFLDAYLNKQFIEYIYNIKTYHEVKKKQQM